MNKTLVAAGALLAVLAAPLHAAKPPPSVGQVKVAKGLVQIERGTATLPATPGTPILQYDLVRTGADGSVGITFEDNSVLSTGPDSILEISRFAFDTTTHDGAFEARLSRGTLSAISGKIAKQTPEAMKIHTPSAILGVRGTEFYVKVVDEGPQADAAAQ